MPHASAPTALSRWSASSLLSRAPCAFCRASRNTCPTGNPPCARHMEGYSFRDRSAPRRPHRHRPRERATRACVHGRCYCPTASASPRHLARACRCRYFHRLHRARRSLAPRGSVHTHLRAGRTQAYRHHDSRYSIGMRHDVRLAVRRCAHGLRFRWRPIARHTARSSARRVQLQRGSPCGQRRAPRGWPHTAPQRASVRPIPAACVPCARWRSGLANGADAGRARIPSTRTKSHDVRRCWCHLSVSHPHARRCVPQAHARR